VKFYEYMRRIGRLTSTFSFELFRATDMYRLQTMVSMHIKGMEAILNEINESVKDLEETYGD
jgi:hypothetical protein